MAKEHPDDNQKTLAEVTDRIWELAEKIDICMFTTWDGEKQRSRPRVIDNDNFDWQCTCTQRCKRCLKYCKRRVKGNDTDSNHG